MADLSAVADNYFTIASETFADNLSSSIAAGAAVVPVNNASEYTNGDCVVLTVDPGTVNEATFIGKKNGNQFEECVWTEGNTGVGHANGATIIDYDSATHHNAQSKGIKQFANDDGTLKSQPIRDALGLSAAATNGWETFPYTMSTNSGYNKGNKQQDVTVPNQDVRTSVSKGMKFRYDRVTPITEQCARFVRSSTQYANRASGSITGTLSTITDDVTFETNIYLESYNNGSVQYIASRFNGTSGWQFRVGGQGNIEVYGFNAGPGNFRGLSGYMALRLHTWYHIAAVLDMSGFTTATNAIYINGISIPFLLSQSGTNPTAWANAGNLEIGSTNGGTGNIDARVHDFRIWTGLRTETQIRDNMYQHLVGSETGLIFYLKLAGNFNDSTASANHVTAQGGAVANYADCCWKNTQYVVCTDVSYSAPNSTLKFQSPNGQGVPNAAIQSLYYSTQARPYGFTPDRNEYDVTYYFKTQFNMPIGAINQWWVSSQTKCTVPIGRWRPRWQGTFQANSSVSGQRSLFVKWDNNSIFSSASQNMDVGRDFVTGMSDKISNMKIELSMPIEVSVATDYYFYGGIDAASGSEQWLMRNDQGPTLVTLECPYV